MRVPDPAGTRKLHAAALPVAGVIAARCGAAQRLIPAIMIQGLGLAVLPLSARDDIALILTLSFRNGRGHEGEDRDRSRSGGGFATITGLGGGCGEARHGHGRRDDERDECAVHDLSFPVSWVRSVSVRHGRPFGVHHGWTAPMQTGNNGTMLSDNIALPAVFPRQVIEWLTGSEHLAHMYRIAPIIAAAIGAVLFAGTAHAACQVEYKAKRDNPLKLYHDVTTVDAPCASAEAALRAQLAARGLTLLKVLSKRER